MSKSEFNSTEVINIIGNYLAISEKFPDATLALVCESTDRFRKFNSYFNGIKLMKNSLILNFKSILEQDKAAACQRITDNFQVFMDELEKNENCDIFDFCKVFRQDRAYFSMLKPKISFFAKLHTLPNFKYIPYYDEVGRNGCIYTTLNTIAEGTLLNGLYVVDGEEITMEEKKAFIDAVRYYEIKIYKCTFYTFVRRYRRNKALDNNESSQRTRA